MSKDGIRVLGHNLTGSQVGENSVRGVKLDANKNSVEHYMSMEGI